MNRPAPAGLPCRGALQCSIPICIDPCARAFRTVVPFRFAYVLSLLVRPGKTAREAPAQRNPGPRTIAQLSNMDEFS